MNMIAEATAAGVADRVIEFINDRGNASFAELEMFLEPLMTVRGTQALELVDVPNVLLWADVSPEFVSLMTDLVGSGRLFLHPSCVMVYLFDGRALPLPVAKKPKPGGYKHPRWVPVVLRTVPPVAPKGRRP